MPLFTRSTAGRPITDIANFTSLSAFDSVGHFRFRTRTRNWRTRWRTSCSQQLYEGGRSTKLAGIIHFFLVSTGSFAQMATVVREVLILIPGEVRLKPLSHYWNQLFKTGVAILSSRLEGLLPLKVTCGFP